MKTAIVIGATGLIGRQTALQLLNDNRYEKVKIFARRSFGINHPKLDEHIVDFDNPASFKEKICGDDLFSAMGTTIKKAGSKEAQYKIDFTYQYEFAKAASENGVKNYMLVSSAGANASSKNFYLRIKGNLEEEIASLPFRKIIIFQPSLLVGEREEKRLGEAIGFVILSLLLKIIHPLRKYKPIRGEEVAKAMIEIANTESKERITRYALDEIFNLF